MKEVYEPLCKGKRYRELMCPLYILVEERWKSLPLDLKYVEWRRKV
jgi:hypothetical protein